MNNKHETKENERRKKAGSGQRSARLMAKKERKQREKLVLEVFDPQLLSVMCGCALCEAGHNLIQTDKDTGAMSFTQAVIDSSEYCYPVAVIMKYMNEEVLPTNSASVCVACGGAVGWSEADEHGVSIPTHVHKPVTSFRTVYPYTDCHCRVDFMHKAAEMSRLLLFSTQCDADALDLDVDLYLSRDSEVGSPILVDCEE